MDAVAAAAKRKTEFGPDSAGVLMTPRQFDRAEFEDGSRYELINAVLVVSPIPSEKERGLSDELARLLLNYFESLEKGETQDATLPEHTVITSKNRRRADRVIWAGLGRRPRKGDTPTIVVELVSAGKRDRHRDYEDKRDEYLAVSVKEYWIIDRFKRSLTVWTMKGRRPSKTVVKEKHTYNTPLLPGFELPLARLLAVADDWE